jgi:ribonuclease HI
MDIYTDGSYLNGVAKWAFVVVQDDEVVHSASGIITDPKITEGWQIGGEIQAVIEAVKHSKQMGKKASIFFDYNGLRNWVSDIWGEKPWRTNKAYSIAYRQFMLDNQEHIAQMIKVEAHTGNKFNEYVDTVAKKAK